MLESHPDSPPKGTEDGTTHCAGQTPRAGSHPDSPPKGTEDLKSREGNPPLEGGSHPDSPPKGTEDPWPAQRWAGRHLERPTRTHRRKALKTSPSSWSGFVRWPTSPTRTHRRKALKTHGAPLGVPVTIGVSHPDSPPKGTEDLGAVEDRFHGPSPSHPDSPPKGTEDFMVWIRGWDD